MKTIVRTLRRRTKWIIACAYLCVVISFVSGAILFFNPLVEYHGRLLWQSDLNANYHPLYCAQNPGTPLYRELARFVPVISFYACFDTNLAALEWMRQHPTQRP